MSKYGKEVSKYLAKVQKGDKSQLGKVFDLTANHLRVVANYYLVNKSYCDDVVSDAFVKVLKYINSFDVKQDGYNWLCKIVQKTAYTYNEKERKDILRTIPLEQAYDIGAEADDEETKVDLITAMNSLPQKNKETIYDYFYNDLTYEEIAAQNNIVKSAVFKRVHTAFSQIKDFLENGEPDK